MHILKDIDMKISHKQKAQKVTTITQYKDSNMVVVTLSFGYLAIINAARMEVINIQKVHRGKVL